MLHSFMNPIGLLTAGAVALLAFLFGLILASLRSDIDNPLTCALEAAVLALAGGLAARAFNAAGLALLGGARGGIEVLAWSFLLWMGPFDLLHHIFSGAWWLTTARMLGAATIIGGLIGGLNGAWRIHDWRGLGWLAFPIDITWGLCGNINALLLHAINGVISTQHAGDFRQEAHRYVAGFGLQSGYRFTQGNVISNTYATDTPGTDLYTHERTHVWQGRAFGPFYTLTYVGWMVAMLIPALIAGLVTGANPLKAMRIWCYFNNPWEAWAYAAGNDDRNWPSWSDAERKLIWGPLAVSLAAVPVYAVTIGTAFLIAKSH